jgi:flagellar biosynthesis GTPase FlhF
MSEKLHYIDKTPEKISGAENANEHLQDKIEERVEQAAHEAQNKHEKNLEAIREQVQEKAQSAEQVKTLEESDRSHTPTDQPFANRELKEMAYKRTLNRVRQQISSPDRLVSRIIHQPTVNAVSEAMSKTIGRPSGLLGGGFLSLVGTSVYYYVTKHYGYEYNNLIFLILLVGGFIAGWLVEALWHLFSSRKKVF